MAKWLKNYLSVGSRKLPPQPPKPDYSESEILKAYRAQRNLDFEDPYEESEGKGKAESEIAPGSPLHHKPSVSSSSHSSSSSPDIKYISPKHRLIKVDSNDISARAKALSSEENKHRPDATDDDYSDPFDTRHEARREANEKQEVENNGYMEPYEAQRVIVEFQRKGDKKLGKGLQLYDTPYEPRGNDEESDTENATAQKTRESRLPQDDERPADEYDQPWEWKKDHISKAFAVQFEGCDWDRSSPPTKERLKQQKQLSPLTAGSKYTKPQTPEHSTLLGERVDPTLPLEKQVWYHGAVSRAEAESLLMLCKECSYLVRNSETSRNDYSLSLRSSQGFMHMKFSRTKDSKYILGLNSAPFDSIPEVIEHYTSRKLPIKGAEHLSLLFPVVVQTL
ncbi:SH2 domain-containing adapter protein F [Callorhinchus milii]|uniref:Src homology 2 domain containing transforming protein D, b n=1 Tax=Callorhinchus milii TaxID=7868 RepID=A0A4W3JZE1_CALMI|nr:SH2 domain-containing adapter protein F [Callorhinchus milii]|eukprot:gi/632966305/ref/XP_007899341.1/ PREDICTED: SH2 domain-containing adapter protein D [Callorhinchus milii]